MRCNFCTDMFSGNSLSSVYLSDDKNVIDSPDYPETTCFAGYVNETYPSSGNSLGSVYLSDYEIVVQSPDNSEATHWLGSVNGTHQSENGSISFESEKDWLIDEVKVIFWFAESYRMARLCLLFYVMDTNDEEIQIRFIYNDSTKTPWYSRYEKICYTFSEDIHWQEFTYIEGIEFRNIRMLGRFIFNLVYVHGYAY